MFTAHTQNKQQELSRCLFKLRHTCVINSVIGKGIEPHPTDGHCCEVLFLMSGTASFTE